MTFVPKNIFLADDNDKQRSEIKKALEAKGHRVVLEAANGKAALELASKARELGIDIAVLDCYMPDKDDGVNVAGALNAEIPSLLVVSASSMWIGTWKDPNFDETKPYNQDFYSYDINGRSELKGPDFYVDQVGWNFDLLAERLGEMTFSLRDERRIQSLEASSTNYQSRK
jgi:CheY-like chemotaxis protein